MNRAKAILLSLRLANSYLSTRLYTRARPLCSQVTLFPYHSLPLSNQSYRSHLVNTHQRLYISSTPDSVANLVLSNVWSTELESELEDLHPTWTHETVIFVLKKLYKDPKKAFDFFNWVCEKMGFRPSSSLYCIMLRILADQETMKQFWFTVKKMKDEGFYIDENTYLSISGQFKKAKMASDVAALFHFYKGMIQENAMDGVVESVVNVILGSVWSDSVEKQLEELNVVLSDNIVMRVLMKLRSHPSIASSFFHWVGHCQNYEHNTVTYNAIARILCQRDSIEEFWSVIEEMKGAGYEIDVDTYIKVSRQLQKNKMMEDSVRLYELMMDGPFKSSAQDCIMLLQSISRSEKPDLDLAFRVVKKFESAGHTLSKAVYDGIHRSLTGAGRFDEAEKIVNVMKNAGYEPDNITYSQLVFGLCKAKRLDEACRVVDEMEAHGCVPDIKTWTILIQGHCAAGEVDKALMCFANMMGKNCDADADLLDVLVNGFISQGKIEGAYNLLIEMVNRARLRPWQATIKVLIEKLLRVMKLEEALDLLRLMKKQNYPPYAEPFVQYISKFGTVEDAADFLKALTVKEYPSSSAYVHVLKSFFQEGRYSEAKDLLYKCPHHVRKHDEICKLFGSKDSTADAA